MAIKKFFIPISRPRRSARIPRLVTGNLIFTSGQVPIDPKTGKIEAATIEQTEDRSHEKPTL